MTERAVLSPETTRAAVQLARALTAALRSWILYPADHPAVAAAVERLEAACTAATAHGPLGVAITPSTLLLDGKALDPPDLAVQEAAALLHDRDLLQLVLVSPPPPTALRALLALLALDRETLRARGGPAAIWAAEGHSAVIVEQIDYQELLAREAAAGPARRDALWQALVRSIVAGRTTFGEAEQRRLLEIAGDAGALGEFVADCCAPFCTADGAPLVTTQAAAVLAVYRHMATTVSVLEPERVPEVLRTLALGASALEPGLAMEVLRAQDAPGDRLPIVQALRQTFDDQQVALLLARVLATQQSPTGRLAQVLDTLAPDPERRERVLRMARQLVGERDFGSTRPIEALRASLDELLLKYDQRAFVSADYEASLAEASGRALEMAARELPPELPQWLETLRHDNVRRLSAQLLIDLLAIETDAGRAGEVARDMAQFAADLVLAGAYDEATRLVAALGQAACPSGSAAPDACRDAVADVGRSEALREAVALLGEMTPGDARALGDLVAAVGAPAAPALLQVFEREHPGTAGERAADLIVRLGSGAVPAVAKAAQDERWFVQRHAALLLGRLGTAAAVPPLQALLRHSDLRVLRAAVASLAGIADPAAARALHTVLRAVRGEARTTVIGVLVGLKDPRVAPLLVHVLEQSRPLGADHALVLEALGAVALLRDPRTVGAVARLAAAGRWLVWRRTRRLRAAALRTLWRMGLPEAAAAFERLAREGGWSTRRMARRLQRGGAV